MKIPLQFSPSVGTHINVACREAIGLAGDRNRPVWFLFNGRKVRVHKRLKPEHVIRQWDERAAASLRRYRISAEGKAVAAKRLAEIARKQQSVEEALELLPGVIADEGRLMHWLKDFVPTADDIGVIFSKGELAQSLEQAGYVEDEHVGKAPEWFDSRPKIARFVVGQALARLKIGTTPHPITASFVDRYFECPNGGAVVPLGAEENEERENEEGANQ